MGGMALDAWIGSNKVQSDISDSITNAYRAIMEDRARENAFNLQMANFYTGIDDTKRNEYLTRINNGHGLVGALKNMFGNKADTAPVKNTTDIDRSLAYKGGDVAVKPNVADVIIEKAKGDRIDTSNALQDIGADGEYNVFQREDGSGIALDKLQNAELDRLNYAEDKRLRREQAGINRENKKIDAENTRAMLAEDKKKEAFYKKNPDAYYSQFINDIGIEIPKEFTGSRSDMKKQNSGFYTPLIEEAIKRGDVRAYNKFNREWQANEKLIDANWLKDGGKGSYGNLIDWTPAKKGGGEVIEIEFKRKFKDGDSFEADSGTETVPMSVWLNGGHAGVQKWLEENRSSVMGNVDQIKIVSTSKAGRGKNTSTADERAISRIGEQNEYAHKLLAKADEILKEDPKNKLALAEKERAQAIITKNASMMGGN